MSSLINATTSNGVQITPDNTGNLALQSNGTTIATVSSTGVAVTGAITTNGVTGSPYQMKNRVINGAMVIDQRNAGASVTPANEQYVLDRWVAYHTASSKFSVQQNAGSVTPPAGFTNYLGVTSLSAYTVSSSDYFVIGQRIEGFNTADLSWGTANAKTVTLSFQVYSSLTGTFGGTLMNNAGTQAYPFTYTISSANTWTSISITIAGSTTGTWLSTTGRGIQVQFGLGAGSSVSATAGSWASGAYYSATGATSVVGTNGATWYVTGVQLEVGSVASAFEWRPYTTELNLCQRYFQKSYAVETAVPTATTTNAAYWYPAATTTYASVWFTWFQVMRTSATVTLYNPSTNTTSQIRNSDAGTNLAAYVNATSSNYCHIVVNNVSVSANSTLLVHWTASAEL